MKLNQLSGLRGICAWWVVIFHSQALLGDSLPAPLRAFVAHGYLAVDLFFLLSGFVIYLSYHAALATNSPRSIGKFYWYRLCRIYPLHLVMLCGFLVLALFFIYVSESGSLPKSYTWSAFFQSVFLVHSWLGTGLTWNVPSWSISSEWFVYLLFPLMALGLRKLPGGVAAHLLGIVLAAAALHVVYEFSDVPSLGDDTARMALIRTLLEFLMGVFIGSLYVNHPGFLQRYQNQALAGFVVACALYVATDAADYSLVPIAFFCLIAYLSVASSWISAVLSRPSLVYVGEISYSTYMVHYLVYALLKAGFVSSSHGVNPLYVWMSFAVVFALSVVLHHLVDTPSQKYLRRLPLPSFRLAA